MGKQLIKPKRGSYGEYTPQPTEYKGVTFRSQLEARWAAYFDLCGIEWAYEPMLIKFGGSGWLPDFSVSKNGFTALVEVKPGNSYFDLEKYDIGLIRHQCVLLCTTKIGRTKLMFNIVNFSNITSYYTELFPKNQLELWEQAKLMVIEKDNKKRYKTYGN